LYEKLKPKGLEIIALDGLSDTGNALQFIRDNKLPYTFLENGKGKEEVVKDLFRVRSYPTSFIIDRDGKIVGVHIGFDEGDEAKYEEQLLGLLSREGD
jgi:hypothetical protein